MNIGFVIIGALLMAGGALMVHHKSKHFPVILIGLLIAILGAFVITFEMGKL